MKIGRLSRADGEGEHAHEIEPVCTHAKERAREEGRGTWRGVGCMGGGRRDEKKVAGGRELGRVRTMHATVPAIFQNNPCVGAEFFRVHQP